MGVHILALNPDGERVAKWDWIRQGHDRMFTELIDYCKVETYKGDNWKLEDTFRPMNCRELREEMLRLEWDDYLRYDELLRLVEDGCWIEFSW